MTSLATLEDLVVDQFSYYAEPDLTDPDLEIWVVDAETDEVVLCADANLGMGKVETESIIYGNLGATFRRMIGTVGYQGSLFRVHVYHNGSDPCEKDESDNADKFGKSDEKRLGSSAIVNYESLSLVPIVGTNATFFIRLRPESGSSYPVPRSITNILSDNTLSIDQVTLGEEIEFGDSNDVPEIEIHITDATTGEMIACSGDSEGLRPVQNEGLTYGKLFADLLKENAALVDFEDQIGTSVKVVMVDNDGTACPEPIETAGGDDSETDDVLGESEVLLWDDLPGTEVLLTDGAGSVVFNFLPNF